VDLAPRPAVGGIVLDIELTSPCGQALLEPGRGSHRLSAPGLDRPDGQESGRIDLGAELDDVFRQAS